MKSILWNMVMGVSTILLLPLQLTFAEFRDQHNTENRDSVGRWYSGLAKDGAGNRYAYTSSEIYGGTLDGLAEDSPTGFISLTLSPENQCKAQPTFDLFIEDKSANAIRLDLNENMFVGTNGVETRLRMLFSTGERTEELKIELGKIVNQKKLENGKNYASIPLSPVTKSSDYFVGKIVSASKMVAVMSSTDSETKYTDLNWTFSLNGSDASLDRAVSLCTQLQGASSKSEKDQSDHRIRISPECLKHIQAYRSNGCVGYGEGSTLCVGIASFVHSSCPSVVSQKELQ